MFRTSENVTRWAEDSSQCSQNSPQLDFILCHKIPVHTLEEEVGPNVLHVLIHMTYLGFVLFLMQRKRTVVLTLTATRPWSSESATEKVTNTSSIQTADSSWTLPLISKIIKSEQEAKCITTTKQREAFYIFNDDFTYTVVVDELNIWLRIFDRTILTGEKRSPRRRTCQNCALFNTNPKRTGLDRIRVSPYRPATNQSSHGIVTFTTATRLDMAVYTSPKTSLISTIQWAMEAIQHNCNAMSGESLDRLYLHCTESLTVCS